MLKSVSVMFHTCTLTAPFRHFSFTSSFLFQLFQFYFLIRLSSASFLTLPRLFPVFLCPFFLPVTSFNHHSSFLQPHPSISGLGRTESERRALLSLPPTTPPSSHFLLIWYEWFSWKEMAQCAVFAAPLLLSCEFCAPLTLPAFTSLENLNLSYIVPPFRKNLFSSAHKASQTAPINALRAQFCCFPPVFISAVSFCICEDIMVAQWQKTSWPLTGWRSKMHPVFVFWSYETEQHDSC